MVRASPPMGVPLGFVTVTLTVDVLVPFAGMFCGLAVTATVFVVDVWVTVVVVVEAV